MRSLEQFYELCRLCGNTYRQSKDLFIAERSLLLADLVYYCLKLEIRRDDCLPQKICMQCFQQLDNWNFFWDMSYKTQNMLSQLYKKLHKEQDNSKNMSGEEFNSDNQDKKLKKGQKVGRKGSSLEVSSTNCVTDVNVSKVTSSCNNKDSKKRNNVHNSRGFAVGVVKNGSPIIVNNQKRRTRKVNMKNIQQTSNANTEQADDNIPVNHTENSRLQEKKKENLKIKLEAFENEKRSNIIKDSVVSVTDSVTNKCNVDVIQSCNMSDDCEARSIEGEKNSMINIVGSQDLGSSNTDLSIEKGELQHEERKKTNRSEIQCEVCNKFFKTKSALRRHVDIHSDEMKYCCDVCGSMFKTISGLLNHVHIHKDVYRFECSYCQKGFRQSNHLQEHLRTHTGEKPHACTSCRKTFRTRSQLSRHVAAIHEKYKKFSCDVCSKEFLYKKNYSDHMMRHAGKKPISCTLCEKSFVTMNEFQRHMRQHTGEKPFKCDICSRLFADCSNLGKHKMVHANEGKTKRVKTAPAKRQEKVATKSRRQKQTIETILRKVKKKRKTNENQVSESERKSLSILKTLLTNNSNENDSEPLTLIAASNELYHVDCVAVVKADGEIVQAPIIPGLSLTSDGKVVISGTGQEVVIEKVAPVHPDDIHPVLSDVQRAKVLGDSDTVGCSVIKTIE